MFMESCLLEGVGGQTGGTPMMMKNESRSLMEKGEYGSVYSKMK